MMLDACHSAGNGGTRGIGSGAISTAPDERPLASHTGPPASTPPPGTATADSNSARSQSGRFTVSIFATGPNELSKEDESTGHGIFTLGLLKGLRGDADRDRDGLVTGRELGEFLHDAVAELARQVNGRQTPVMLCNPGGERLALTR
jgi:hypothetical protein